jgi:hypothetical protein
MPCTLPLDQQGTREDGGYISGSTTSCASGKWKDSRCTTCVLSIHRFQMCSTIRQRKEIAFGTFHSKPEKSLILYCALCSGQNLL